MALGMVLQRKLRLQKPKFISALASKTLFGYLVEFSTDRRG